MFLKFSLIEKTSSFHQKNDKNSFKVLISISFVQGGEIVLVQFELQHFCCGPKGCQLELEYGELVDVEE